MTTVYQEGPFRNWVAVNWPSERILVSVSPGIGALGVVGFTPVDSEGAPLAGFDVTKFQAVITGKTSGASVDLRNVSVSTAPSWAFGSPTACLAIPTDIYQYPSGTAMAPGDEPALGAAINSTTGTASILSIGSSFYNGDAEDPACILNFNAPALPGFIDGEDATLSNP